MWTRLRFLFPALFISLVAMAPPDEEAAFLSAIKAEPKDNTARLVYADWLDEHGKPERAEFIRLQIRLASLKPTDSEYSTLKGRERVLRNNPKATGLATWFYTTPARSPVRADVPSVETKEERAHLEAIRDNPMDLSKREAYSVWLKANGRPVQADLIKWAIWLYGAEPSDVAYKIALDRFNDLLSRNRESDSRSVPAFAVKIPERGIIPTFERGFVSGIQCTEQRFVDRGEAILELAPALERLEINALPMHYSTLSLDSFRILARGKPVNLAKLVLTGMTILTDDIGVVSPALPKLAHLDLRDARIGGLAFLALIRGRLGARLTSLRVHETFLADNGAPLDAISGAVSVWANSNGYLAELSPSLRDLLPEALHGRVQSAEQVVCRRVLAAFLSPF